MEQDPGATVHRGYTRAGDYDLVRKMGAGGFGTVFEARHRATGLPYAIKRIYLSPEDAERFRNEALYPARIASESLHVLGVISFFHDGDADAFYVVTELIAHGDLRTFLDKQPRPLPLALGFEVGLGIAKGLAAIHAQHIVHRDLKPANVLMDRKDGRWIAKITDFGLARSVSSVSIAQFATSGYAAPEQLDLLTDVPLGPESDLFSYGMVLYELLTGDKPTAAVGLKEYGRWLAARVQPPAPSRVRPELAASPAIDRLIARLLDFDRTTRMASAEEVVRILESVRHPAPAPLLAPAAPLLAPAPPPPLPSPPPPPLRRQEPVYPVEPRWRMLLGTAPVFAATGCAMFFTVPWRWLQFVGPMPLHRFTMFAFENLLTFWLLVASSTVPMLFGVALALAARVSVSRLLATAGLSLAAYNLACGVAIISNMLFGRNVAALAGCETGALAMLGSMAWILGRRPSAVRTVAVTIVGLLAGLAALWLVTEYQRTIGVAAFPLAFATWQVAVGLALVEPPSPFGRPWRWWPLATLAAASVLLSFLASAK